MSDIAIRVENLGKAYRIGLKEQQHETMRGAALLNTGPMPWDLIGMGAITTARSFLLGAIYFRRTGRFFADFAQFGQG